MADRDNFGVFLLGFLVGGLTGAVVSLLYAPQSGEQTRAVIKEKAIELRDKTTDTLEETYNRAEIAASDAVEKAQELIKLAQEKSSELVEKGQVVLEETKDKVKSKKAAAE
jgi:gas vesicle protein